MPAKQDTKEKGNKKKKIRKKWRKTPTHKNTDKLLHSGPAPVALASSGGRLGLRIPVRRAVAAAAGAAGPPVAAPAAGTHALAAATEGAADH